MNYDRDRDSLDLERSEVTAKIQLTIRFDRLGSKSSSWSRTTAFLEENERRGGRSWGENGRPGSGPALRAPVTESGRVQEMERRRRRPGPDVR